MNIYEALKTGLPLRRPIAKHWGSEKTGWVNPDHLLSMMPPSKEDLLADDWEVRRPLLKAYIDFQGSVHFLNKKPGEIGEPHPGWKRATWLDEPMEKNGGT